MIQHFVSEVADRSATIGVVGLGYVGLPLALAFVEAGFAVRGIDLDAQRVEAIMDRRSYIEDVPASRVASAVGCRLLRASEHIDEVGHCQAVLICVPTPLGSDRLPDLRAVEAAADGIASHLKPGTLVVLESTTYPGCTRELVLPKLMCSGLIHGEGFLLAYSPERENPGSKHSVTTVPKVVGGISPEATRAAHALYATIAPDIYQVSSARVAEASKLVENIYRCVNIALVNELKECMEPMGVDILEAIDAAATKPFGFHAFYPGPGVGGHCIPVDPLYLSWRANALGRRARFIELATEVNRRQPARVVSRVIEALGHDGKSLNGAHVLLLGLSYKGGVGDLRESPSLVVRRLLAEGGALVSCHDPCIGEEQQEVPVLEAVDLGSFDAVVLLTDHPSAAVDYEQVWEQAGVIVDTRGVFRHKPPVVGVRVYQA